MSMHISLNVETNFAHFGRMELGLGRDASRPYFSNIHRKPACTTSG